MPQRKEVNELMATFGISRTQANNKLRKRGTNPDYRLAISLADSKRESDKDLLKKIPRVEVKLRGVDAEDKVYYFKKVIIPKRKSIAK